MITEVQAEAIVSSLSYIQNNMILATHFSTMLYWVAGICVLLGVVIFLMGWRLGRSAL